MRKDNKKQKAARKLLLAQEQKEIFEQGVQLGMRIANQEIPGLQTINHPIFLLQNGENRGL